MLWNGPIGETVIVEWLSLNNTDLTIFPLGDMVKHHVVFDPNGSDDSEADRIGKIRRP
jgi:hypothetical protein